MPRPPKNKSEFRALAQAVRSAISPAARAAGALSLGAVLLDATGELGFGAAARASAGASAKAATRTTSRASTGAAQVVVASYAPIRGELDPNGFVELLKRDGGELPHLVFPRVCADGGLTLHYCELSELVPGAYGIPEPPETCPTARLEDIDIMLVPGVAFDRRGGRLGYGKGYYDGLLGRLGSASLRQSPKSPHSSRSLRSIGDSDDFLDLRSRNAPEGPLLIGISYDETLFDQLPTEPHDICMDAIATPLEIIKVS